MKCDYCGKEITTVSYKTLNRKHYHLDCYNLMLEELEQKEQVKKEQSNRLITGNKAIELQQIEQFICDRWNIKTMPYQVARTIENYITDYRYTHIGILQSLIYFYDILNNPLYETPSVGIVPFIYDEAQEFYKQVDLTHINNKDKTIVEHNKKISIKKPNSKLKCKINIEDL